MNGFPIMIKMKGFWGKVSVSERFGWGSVLISQRIHIYKRRMNKVSSGPGKPGNDLEFEMDLEMTWNLGKKY